MSAILRVLDAEISKYEALVKQLKASRQAIASAETAGGAAPKGRPASAAAPAKRRGRPPKNGAAKGSTNSAPSGKKRGRPPKQAAEAAPAAAAE